MNHPEVVDILLVEDTASDVELLQRALHKHRLDCTLAIAHDGAEALEYLFPGNHAAGSALCIPKLILLDLKLPQVSGLEVLRRIKSDQDKKSIPVVVFSSSAQDEDIAACYRYGANSYVQKPVSFDEYLKVVAGIVSFWLHINITPVAGWGYFRGEKVVA
jgi:two-component system response regulator